MSGFWAPTGRTRVAGVIGDPVRHSLSPVLHNAAFRALDLDWAYVAFEVAVGGADAAVAGMRALGIDGLNVTMPHKGDVAGAMDALSPDADRLGAVNTIVRDGSRLVGHNTDGEGFLRALRHDENVDVDGKRCVVRGAGGAARAVALALVSAGAADVVITARRAEAAEEVVALVGPPARVGGEEEADGADLLVNATPVGMDNVVGMDPAAHAFDPARLGPGQVVVDLIYDPLVTPLLEAARGRGAVAVNGLGMLLHQAACAFRLWTGQDAPVEAMSAAVLAELARRP